MGCQWGRSEYHCEDGNLPSEIISWRFTQFGFGYAWNSCSKFDGCFTVELGSSRISSHRPFPYGDLRRKVVTIPPPHASRRPKRPLSVLQISPRVMSFLSQFTRQLPHHIYESHRRPKSMAWIQSGFERPTTGQRGRHDAGVI